MALQESFNDYFIFPQMRIASLEKNNTIKYNSNFLKSICLFSTNKDIFFIGDEVTVLYNAIILISINNIKKDTIFDMIIITKINNLPYSNYHIKLSTEVEYDVFNVQYITLEYESINIKSKNIRQC